jgi:apolipoprotein N-acyltransferase
VIGMTGLSLMIPIWSAASVPFILKGNRTDKFIALIILATLPGAFVWGWQRDSAATLPTVGGVTVRLVQPNISQDEKWRTDNASRVFDVLVAASTAPGKTGEKITQIIWPESAVPFLVDESDGARAVLRTSLVDGQTLVTGAIRRARREPSSDHFTSVLVFDHDGNATGIYDKWRLVPGGEFLPFEWLLGPLGFQQLVSLPGGFSAGTGPHSLSVGSAGMAGVVICYEAIFPDRLIDSGNRPTWLINVTNDGWFGTSTGPYQHLAQARMRAIEQGLPLARSANTGISAMIDPYGHILTRLPLGQSGFLDAKLPLPLAPTLYALWGDYMLLIVIFAIALFQLASRANCQDR